MNNWKILIPLAFITIFSIVVGHFLISANTSLAIVKSAGYWFILLTSILFFYALYQAAFSKQVLSRRFSFKYILKRKNITILLILLAAFSFMRVHEETEFKIVMDEPVLMGTSMAMHRERQVFVPTRAHTIDGVYTLLNGYVDKRPNFFPFLVSVLHDVLGYRVTNGFILNFLLTGVLIGLTYFVGYRISNRKGGIASILMLISLPLLIRTANGAGFELLNLIMIELTLLLSIFYLENASQRNLSALCLSAVMLCQVRYESVIYLLPVVCVIIYQWRRTREIKISWALLLSPVLLIPYLLQHKAFAHMKDLWQLDDRPSDAGAFSLEYIFENIGHAVNFFFNLNKDMPNSLLLSVVGLVCILFFLLSVFRSWKEQQKLSPVVLVLSFFFIGFLLNGFLVLAYFFGQLDDQIIRRLSLPLHLPLIFISVWLIYKYNQCKVLRKSFIGVICLFLVIVTLPATALRIYSKSYRPSSEAKWVQDYVDRLENKNKQYLVLSEYAVLWVLYEVDTLVNGRANLRENEIQWYLDQPHSPKILVHDVQRINMKTGEYAYGGKYALSSNFKREPVELYNLTATYRIQISDLLEVSSAEVFEEEDELVSENEYLLKWGHRLP